MRRRDPTGADEFLKEHRTVRELKSHCRKTGSDDGQEVGKTLIDINEESSAKGSISEFVQPLESLADYIARRGLN